MATARFLRSFAWAGAITPALALSCYGQTAKPNQVMPPKRLQAVDVKRISDTVVEIIPKEPLPSGQYVLRGPPTIGIYDFGVPTKQTEHAAWVSSLADQRLQLDGKRCRSSPT